MPGMISTNAPLQRPIGRGFVVRGNVDLASVFDVDFYASLLDDGADHLAAGPNHVANLVHRDLQGGDAIFRASDFKVHIAVVVFSASDVGQDGVVFSFFDQPHCHARDRSLQRNAGVHKRQSCAAYGCHRGGAVGLQNVRDHAHRVRPLLLGGKHGGNGAFGERTVTDLAASGATQKGNFTN